MPAVTRARLSKLCSLCLLAVIGCGGGDRSRAPSPNPPPVIVALSPNVIKSEPMNAGTPISKARTMRAGSLTKITFNTPNWLTCRPFASCIAIQATPAIVMRFGVHAARTNPSSQQSL